MPIWLVSPDFQNSANASRILAHYFIARGISKVVFHTSIDQKAAMCTLSTVEQFIIHAAASSTFPIAFPCCIAIRARHKSCLHSYPELTYIQS